MRDGRTSPAGGHQPDGDGDGEDEVAFRARLGEQLRVHRVRLDLTQETVGHWSGTSRNFLCALELGRHGVDVWRLRRIAAALGTTLPDLLYATENTPSE